MSRDFGVVAENLRRSTVHVRGSDARRGGGSGIIWPGGVVITNAHVVNGHARSDRLFIDLWDGRSFEAKVAKTDPRRDLALLKVSITPDAPAAVVGDSSALRAGQIVVAVGNPLGSTLR